MSDDQRERALGFVAKTLRLPDIHRLVQRGSDQQLARFALEFVDGRVVRFNSVDDLWSQAAFGKAISVVVHIVPPALDAKDWRGVVRALIESATDVVEVDGERFEDAVTEWLSTYADGAGSDRDGAAAMRAPFRDAGQLYVCASAFAKYVRREFSEAVKMQALYQALGDLGFERTTINYRVSGKRSTTSYYRGPLALLGTHLEAA
jgi:hypothetical protein